MLSVLVLCDLRSAAQQRVAILDHVRFLDHAESGRVRVTYVNMAEVSAADPQWLAHDVIVLHTTLLCWRWYPQFAALARQLDWMQQFTGLVVAMPQDEYDHAHTLDEWLVSLRTQLVVTCFGETHRALLYPRMHQRAFFIEALTGYLHPARVAASRAQVRSMASRTTDIVYRANHLPYWFGWLGQIKARLGLDAPRLLEGLGLRLDISVRPEDTVLGEQWLDFLGGSRSILGSESGSSVLDKRGEVGLQVRALLADQPSLSFADADALCGGELTRYHFAALGPRHLEAIMTGTVQILVEGEYSGLFKPWEHYIPIKRDLSDLPSVVEVLRDDARMTETAERATAEFVSSGAYGYDRFAKHVLDVVDLFGSVQASTGG